VFQHGEQQAFPKPARADEDQLPTGFFQLRNPVGAILIKVAVLNQGGMGDSSWSGGIWSRD